MNDAQMSMFAVLRPASNFQELYQGQDGTIPIAFPGGLDPQAGESGYDRNLMAAVAVPLGGRMLMQVPMTVELYTAVANYEYQLIWRTRNQSDVNRRIAKGQQATAYHLPSEALGRKEIQSGPDTADRFFIPGASDVEVFEQGEPVSGAATLNIRQQRYIPQITTAWEQPLTGPGVNDRGVWQQGVYQFSSNEGCSGPTFAPIWTDICGDELVILCYKVDTDAAWDFTGADLAFSNTYGNNDGGLPLNPNIGIILSTGMMGT